MVEKILKWAFFGVLVSLAPIFANGLNLVSSPTTFEWTKILGNGELLLMACAMCAGAIGELISSAHPNKSLKLLSGGGCMIVILVGSIYFASVSGARISGSPHEMKAVMTASLSIYGLALVTCLAAVALSEV